MMDKRKTRLICLMICKGEFYTENNRFGNKIKMNRSACNGEAPLLSKTKFNPFN